MPGEGERPWDTRPRRTNLEMPMSSKSTPASSPTKSSDGRKRPAHGKHANCNGNGNGHNRHAAADGAAKARKPARQRGITDGDGDSAMLEGQPPIAALIGLARDGSRQLDKKTL